MEVQYNQQIGVVEVWVRNAERNSEETQRALQAIYARCAGKCFVAVYYSNQEDLVEKTSWLLCSNQRHMQLPRTHRTNRTLQESTPPLPARKRTQPKQEHER